MKDCWYLGKKCLYEPPEGYYGYVYLIEVDRTLYIGKKAFTHRKKTKLSKKARVGTRKRVEVKQVDSGWLDYYGSSKPLLEYLNKRGNKDGVKRTILKLCQTKQDLAYWEMHYLVTENVLFKQEYWNGNILSKFFKGKINE